ncbi:MAG: class I SAM-dependent methyltransferase [bacterium]
MVTHPLPDKEQIHARYQDSFYSPAGERFSKSAERVCRFFRIKRASYVERVLGRKGSILDVGCGRGIMIHELHKRGWQVAGTQVSATAGSFIRKTFGIDCFIGELPHASFSRHSFDIVTMWHVLEHLPDPLLYLRCCRGLVRPGGYLLIEVPNAASWSARMTKTAWMGWDPLHHMHHYTPSTVRLALHKAGFSPISWDFLSWEYGPFTTLQSILNLFVRRNALFEHMSIANHRMGALRRGHGQGWGLFLQAFFAAVPALFISIFSAACGCGEVIRVIAQATDA